MGKFIIVRTMSPNGDGRTTEKIAETRNGGGPAPRKIFGFAVGKTCTYTKHGKSVLNKQLFRAGFEAVHGHNEHGQQVTGWARHDGCQFYATHDKASSTFERLA